MSVIRQKGESQNGCFKKTKPNFLKSISYSLICTRTSAYQGVKNVCFSQNLACFIFLKHPFWDSPFYFITDEINKNVKGKILLRKIWQQLWMFLCCFLRTLKWALRTPKKKRQVCAIVWLLISHSRLPVKNLAWNSCCNRHWRKTTN